MHSGQVDRGRSVKVLLSCRRLEEYSPRTAVVPATRARGILAIAATIPNARVDSADIRKLQDLPK